MKRLTGHPAINATMPRDFHILIIIICLCIFYDCTANVKCLAGNSAINVKIHRDFHALINLCFMISLLSLL